MKYKYHVDVLGLQVVHEMPGGWTRQDFLDLLVQIDYPDPASIPDEELKEMTAMALSDLDQGEAAEAVLAFRLGQKLNRGQRQHLSEELRDDRLWEQHAEIKFHKDLFHAGCMMHWAFPADFPEPDIAKLRLRITAQNDRSILNLTSPTASFVARLLTDGMGNHNAIYRLFDDRIASNAFPEADDIIWKLESSGFSGDSNTVEITVYTSLNWVDKLKGVRGFESSAYSDGQILEDGIQKH